MSDIARVRRLVDRLIERAEEQGLNPAPLQELRAVVDDAQRLSVLVPFYEKVLAISARQRVANAYEAVEAWDAVFLLCSEVAAKLEGDVE